MPGPTELRRINVLDEITQLSKKILLLEGGKRAHVENSSATRKKNQSIIAEIRRYNMDLHQRLANVSFGDDDVIDQAYRGRPVARAAVRNKTTFVVETIIDLKILENRNKLNLVKACGDLYRCRIRHLKDEYGIMSKDSANKAYFTGSDRKIRNLENRLYKAELKFGEARHIFKTYDKMKEMLIQESLTYENKLKEQEGKVAIIHRELVMTRSMYQEAQVVRDNAKAELARTEIAVAKKKQSVESHLTEMKFRADKEKTETERVAVKIQRNHLQDLVLTQDVSRHIDEEEFEGKLYDFETWFGYIKDSTGISKVENLISMFDFQDVTTRRLRKHENKNNRLINKLRDDLKRLNHVYEMMYCREIPECLTEIAEENKENAFEQRRGNILLAQKLTKVKNIMFYAKSGICYLADKLILDVDEWKELIGYDSSSPEESILDFFSIFREKVARLNRVLAMPSTESLQQDVEEDFLKSLESNTPVYNMRVKFPSKFTADEYENNLEDDNSVPTRADIKRKSQQIVEAKTKKRRKK